MPVRLVLAAAIAVLAFALAGCSAGAGDRSLPQACLGDPDAIVRALATAPAAVRLAGDTRLSTCVGRARSGAELQQLGVSLVRAADALRGRAATDADAALRLGFLAGAVRTGARSSSGGLATQLARSVERATQIGGATPAVRAARERGLLAGERDG